MINPRKLKTLNKLRDLTCNLLDKNYDPKDFEVWVNWKTFEKLKEELTNCIRMPIPEQKNRFIMLGYHIIPVEINDILSVKMKKDMVLVLKTLK